MTETHSELRIRRWFLKSKYLIVTLSIMIFLLIIPYTFTQYVYVGRLLLGFWLGLILVTISFSVYRIKIGGKIALLLIIANLFTIALNATLGTQAIAVINRALTSLTLSFVTMMIFVDLATNKVEKHFTSDYIWGGIATYLLIGLTWGSFFDLIELVTPGSFSTAALNPIDFPAFVYYSYYVITTVGGVLTPITLQAQSIVMIEPIIGTLYIAILVARLVNLVTSRKQEVKPKEMEE